MSKQTVNIGSIANDGSGDVLRTAYAKINDNFTELYTTVDNIAALRLLSTSANTGATAIAPFVLRAADAGLEFEDSTELMAAFR